MNDKAAPPAPSDMTSVALELLGAALAVLGWMAALASCALPMWRVSAFIGVNIVTAQVTWDGLWMSCVVQSTGQMQCKTHDSMLGLSADLQAARALTVTSILLGVLGVLAAVAGAQCTNCVEEGGAKARLAVAAGAALASASLAQLIPVSRCAHSIIQEFYSPVVPEAQKRELGAALYLGWAAAALLQTAEQARSHGAARPRQPRPERLRVKQLLRSHDAKSGRENKTHLRPHEAERPTTCR